MTAHPSSATATLAPPLPERAPASEPPRARRRQADDPERIFAEGKRAAACLVRALDSPQREVQVAIATLLIETHERAPAAIDVAMRRSIETGP